MIGRYQNKDWRILTFPPPPYCLYFFFILFPHHLEGKGWVTPKLLFPPPPPTSPPLWVHFFVCLGTGRNIFSPCWRFSFLGLDFSLSSLWEGIITVTAISLTPIFLFLFLFFFFLSLFAFLFGYQGKEGSAGFVDYVRILALGW